MEGICSLLEIRVLRGVFGCRSSQSKQGVKYSYGICEMSEDGGDSICSSCADSC